MTTIWTACARPSVYEPEHVETLRRQLAKFAPSVDLMALTSESHGDPAQWACSARHWPGSWAKLELIGISFAEDFLYMDPDVLVVGDITPIIETTGVVLLRNFDAPDDGYSTGLMRLDGDARRELWTTFTRRPESWIEAFRSQGDRRFIQEVLGDDLPRWQDILPGQVLSYKRDVAGLAAPPSDARVVCFHGQPRPWQVRDIWVRQALR